MKCLAVCQEELVIRTLDAVLVPGFDVHFIVESKPLARRLHDAGLNVWAGDPRRVDTYLKADVSPNTVTPACVNACIARAMTFGDLDDPESNISRLLAENQHFRLHEELGTGPGFFYLWDKGAS